MDTSGGESSQAVAQSPTPRPPSGLSKMPVLPPINPAASASASAAPMPADATPVAAAPPPPPSPTGAKPSAINDDNVDLFLTKKLALMKHIMGVHDLIENAEKYLPLCRDMTYGTSKGVNRSLSNRLRVQKLFADNGLFEFLKQYWHLLQVKDRDHSVWDLKKASTNRHAQMEMFRSMLTPIINATDIGDPDYCKRFNDELRPFYLSLLDTPLFYCFVDSSSQASAIKALLSALYNLVQKFPDGNISVRDSRGVSIVSRYTVHPDLSVKTIAVLTLSFIVSEDEQDRLEAADEQIKHLIKVLQSCLKSTEVTHYSRIHGFQAEEVVDGLNHMAQVDSNKAAIVRCGALPMYTQLLSKDCDASEQAAASKGLWILAFNEENKRCILQEPGCMDGLRSLLSSTNENVRRSAEGALWAIEGEDKRVQSSTVTSSETAKDAAPATSPDEPTGHVMISYNWGVKSDVIKIKDRLKACGYKVWIDIEQMSGSTLDAMASAIEQAAIVIVVFTQQYKMSPSCRSEAEYCYKMGKPFIPVRLQQKYIADGWLGIILGTRLFYDLTKPVEWEETFEKLCAEINRMVGLQKKKSSSLAELKSVDETDRAGPRLANGGTLMGSPSSDANAQFAASTWSEDDVEKWLCQCGLQSCCKSFSGFTGLQVVELRHALMSAPVYYYGALQQTLNMSLKDAMTFTKMLRDLK